jgi:hypothetical protein
LLVEAVEVQIEEEVVEQEVYYKIIVFQFVEQQL